MRTTLLKLIDDYKKQKQEIERLNKDLLFHKEILNELYNKIDRAVNIYEQSVATEDFSTTDLDMYLVFNRSGG